MIQFAGVVQDSDRKDYLDPLDKLQLPFFPQIQLQKSNLEKIKSGNILIWQSLQNGSKLI